MYQPRGASSHSFAPFIGRVDRSTIPPLSVIRARRQAYLDAGLAPADVSLVEGHGTGTAVGDAVEWSYADMPEKPIETSDWKEKNVGQLVRVRFRLGKDGHYLELQLPLGPNGRPIY